MYAILSYREQKPQLGDPYSSSGLVQVNKPSSPSPDSKALLIQLGLGKKWRPSSGDEGIDPQLSPQRFTIAALHILSI